MGKESAEEIQDKWLLAPDRTIDYDKWISGLLLLVLKKERMQGCKKGCLRHMSPTDPIFVHNTSLQETRVNIMWIFSGRLINGFCMAMCHFSPSEYAVVRLIMHFL